MPHQLQSHMRAHPSPHSHGHHHHAARQPMAPVHGYHPHQHQQGGGGSHHAPLTPQTPSHHGHHQHHQHPASHGHPSSRYGGASAMMPPHSCSSHGSHGSGSFPGPGEHAAMQQHGYPGEQPLFHDQRFVGAHPAETRQHHYGGHHPAEHLTPRAASVGGAQIPYRRSPNSPHGGRSAAAAQVMAAQQHQHCRLGAVHPYAGYGDNYQAPSHLSYGAPQRTPRPDQHPALAGHFRQHHHHAAPVSASQRMEESLSRTPSQDRQHEPEPVPAPRPASAVPSGAVSVPQSRGPAPEHQLPQPPKRTASDEEEAASALLMAAGGLGSKQSSPAPSSRQSSIVSHAQAEESSLKVSAYGRPAAASNCSPSFEIEEKRAAEVRALEQVCQGAAGEVGEKDGDADERNNGGMRSSSPNSAKDKRHSAFMRKRKGASTDEGDSEDQQSSEQMAELCAGAAEAQATAEQQPPNGSPPRPQPCHISPMSADSDVFSPSDETVETASETIGDEARSVSSALAVPGPVGAEAVAVSRRGIAHRRTQPSVVAPARAHVAAEAAEAPASNQHPHLSASAPVRQRRPPAVIAMPHFPSLLHDALTNSSHAGTVVEWLKNGRGWRVLRWDEMRRTVLPEHFPELCVDAATGEAEDEDAAGRETVNNFLWHVKAWGFVECREGGPDMGSYKHNLFLRGNPSLCLQMRLSSAISSRKRVNSSEMSPPAAHAGHHKALSSEVGPSRLDASSIFKARPGAASIRVRPGHAQQSERQLHQSSPDSVRMTSNAASRFSRQLHVPALTPSTSQSDDALPGPPANAASRLVSASPSKRKLRVEYEIGPEGDADRRARSISLQGSGEGSALSAATPGVIRRVHSGGSSGGASRETPKLVWQQIGAPPPHHASPYPHLGHDAHRPQHHAARYSYHSAHTSGHPPFSAVTPQYHHKRTISDTPSSAIPGDIAAYGHPVHSALPSAELSAGIPPAMMGRTSSSRGRARAIDAGIVAVAVERRGSENAESIRPASSFPVSTRGKGSSVGKVVRQGSFGPGGTATADTYSVGERMAGAVLPPQAHDGAYGSVAIAVSRKSKRARLSV